MAKVRTKLRATERAQDTRKLATPQCLPFVDDGIAAQQVMAPLCGGHDAYLTWRNKGGWQQRFIVPSRDALIAARYRDWLAARDQLQSAA